MEIHLEPLITHAVLGFELGDFGLIGLYLAQDKFTRHLTHGTLWRFKKSTPHKWFDQHSHRIRHISPRASIVIRARPFDKHQKSTVIRVGSTWSSTIRTCSCTKPNQYTGSIFGGLSLILMPPETVTT